MNVPRVGQIYRDRRDVYRVRVEAIENQRVHLVYVETEEPKRFTLPYWFFTSDACGWRLVPSESHCDAEVS